MRLYSQKDVDRKALKGARIAVLGYGSQGRAHTLNLKDSGCDVVVGVRKGGASWKKARKDGLEVILTGFFPARPAFAHADDDVAAAVLEVQGVSPPLAAVAEDGDAGALESFAVDVFLRVQPHLTTPRGLAAV